MLWMLLLSISPANAIQVSLSEDKIEQYLRVLELYVLPFLVVATIVLFCGYVASRIFHRAQLRGIGNEPAAPEAAPQKSPDDETAAFLRELTASPPIEDPEPEPKKEQRFHCFVLLHSSICASLR